MEQALTPAEIFLSIRPPMRMSWIISFLPSFTFSRRRLTVASTLERSISSPDATLVAMCSYSSIARRYASRLSLSPAGRSRKPVRSRAASTVRGASTSRVPSVRTDSISQRTRRSMSFWRMGIPGGTNTFSPSM